MVVGQLPCRPTWSSRGSSNILLSRSLINRLLQIIPEGDDGYIAKRQNPGAQHFSNAFPTVNTTSTNLPCRTTRHCFPNDPSRSVSACLPWRIPAWGRPRPDTSRPYLRRFSNNRHSLWGIVSREPDAAGDRALTRFHRRLDRVSRPVCFSSTLQDIVTYC